ncbi:MAG TPA: shikimate dehydrogenase [Pseudolabrys sp.]|nr:shikimate dehydrogenase [Pseudolabrys sp.]
MFETYGGATRVYPIIGDPIAQAKSPGGLTRAFRAAGHDTIVVPMQVKAAQVAAFLRMLDEVANVDGIVATVPHKFAAFAHASSASDRARLLGSANILRRRRQGGWHADMIDGLSLVHAMAKAGGIIAGRRALLAGAGGAGCAIGLELLNAGAAALSIHDIDAARRDRLIALLNTAHPSRVTAGSADAAGFDIVVNATPSGMREDDVPPVIFTKLTREMFVGEVITAPEMTPLLRAAQARGCGIQTGVAMFEASVRLMFDFFTGPQP